MKSIETNFVSQCFIKIKIFWWTIKKLYYFLFWKTQFQDTMELCQKWRTDSEYLFIWVFKENTQYFLGILSIEGKSKTDSECLFIWVFKEKTQYFLVILSIYREYPVLSGYSENRRKIKNGFWVSFIWVFKENT